MTGKVKKALWALLIVAVFGTLGLTGYFLSIDQSGAPDQTAQQIEQQAAETSQQVADEILEIIAEDEAEKQAAIKSGDAVATLDSIRQRGNEFGIATRTFNTVTDNFEIDLLATLSDPQPGGRYVVFINGAEGSLRLGSLDKDIENTYSAAFTVKQDILNLEEVAIIEDGDAVEDVLLGTFAPDDED